MNSFNTIYVQVTWSKEIWLVILLILLEKSFFFKLRPKAYNHTIFKTSRLCILLYFCIHITYLHNTAAFLFYVLKNCIFHLFQWFFKSSNTFDIKVSLFELKGSNRTKKLQYLMVVKLVLKIKLRIFADGISNVTDW